jgi:hypothetical protein
MEAGIWKFREFRAAGRQGKQEEPAIMSVSFCLSLK